MKGTEMDQSVLDQSLATALRLLHGKQPHRERRRILKEQTQCQTRQKSEASRGRRFSLAATPPSVRPVIRTSAATPPKSTTSSPSENHRWDLDQCVGKADRQAVDPLAQTIE